MDDFGSRLDINAISSQFYLGDASWSDDTCQRRAILDLSRGDLAGCFLNILGHATDPWSLDALGRMQAASSQKESIVNDRAKSFVGDLLAIRARTPWVDYSRDEALETDRIKMQYLKQRVPPPPISHMEQCLGRPSFESFPPEFMDLDWIIRARRIVKFFDHDVFLKLFPSLGARHALELYFIFPHYGPQDVLYYEPTTGRLFKVGHARKSVENATLFISCRFRRYMWRYRYSVYYFDFLFDLGHLVESFNMGLKQSVWRLQQLDTHPGFDLLEKAEEVVRCYQFLPSNTSRCTLLDDPKFWI